MLDYVYCTYLRVMRQEAELAKSQFGNSWRIPDAEEMHGTALQTLDVAGSNLVLRVYNREYHLADPLLDDDAMRTAARESVGGHTNLVGKILDAAWCSIYGADYCGRTPDGYTYRNLRIAGDRHDLAEVQTGDTADSGHRDEAAKIVTERKYQKYHSKMSPSRDTKSERRITRLLAQMEDKSTPSGRLIFCSDKSALIEQALRYDQADLPPLRYPNDPNISEHDRAEMKFCDYRTDVGAYFASELWTVDFLKTRGLVQYDDTGFFTALLVMSTLLVHGDWYRWREQDYKPI